MKRRPRPIGSLLLALALLLASAASSLQGARAVQAGAAAKPRPTLPALSIVVQPRQLKIGRDQAVRVRITDGHGAPVPGAFVSMSGAGTPQAGSAAHGVLTFMVHPTALGLARLNVGKKGFAVASLTVPIVPGPPASVVAIKQGLSILAPHAKPQAGKVGNDLFEQYHAATAARQFASLGLRDGTLVDLNSNTDVLIKDPLHTTLSKGELFLEVVHGDLRAHQVQAGTAVAATKGTRLDVQFNPGSNTATVTVVEGQVQVTNKGASVLVGAGQQTSVPANLPPTAPRAVDLSKIIGWVKNLPNSNSSVVPPVLNLPLPKATPVPLPPPASTPAITVTGTLATTTWSGVVLVNGRAQLFAGQTLTIQPGTTVEFTDGGTLTIDGTLNAAGTAAAPITFTSASAKPTPGIWQSLRFESQTAANSVLDNVHVFYGTPTGGGNAGMVAMVGGAGITIRNSVFAQSKGTALWADDQTRPTISNCLFGGNNGAAIDVGADDLTAITAPGFAAGQQGIHIRAGAIAHSGAWTRLDVSTVLDGRVTIPLNSTLTIQPGTVTLMGIGSAIVVDGILNATGTAAAPIVFTSAQPQPRPGDWQSIRFEAAFASNSTFSNVWVFYGTPNGGGNNGMVTFSGGANVTLANDVFEQSAGNAVWADEQSLPVIKNCIFGGNGSATTIGYAADVNVDDLTQLTGLAFGPNQPGVHARGGTVKHSGVWQKPASPYLLDGGTNIPANSTLTIQPGTVVYMGLSASLTVDGSLQAVGNDSGPVVFTSGQPAPKPGDWQSIRFESRASGRSVLDHLLVAYGTPNGGGNNGMVTFVGGAAPAVRNSVFENSAGNAMWADSQSRPVVTNCVFDGNKGYAIDAPADGVDTLTGIIEGPAQAGIRVSYGSITHNSVWQVSNAPIVLATTLTIQNHASLTLPPGMVLALLSGYGIEVGGALIARGTAGAPIAITSIAAPGITSPERAANAAPKRGDWQNIYMYGTSSSSSVLDYVQISYGAAAGGGAQGMINVVGGAAPSITNSTIGNAMGYGIWADSQSRPTITGNTFHDLVGAAIVVPVAAKGRISGNHAVGGLTLLKTY